MATKKDAAKPAKKDDKVVEKEKAAKPKAKAKDEKAEKPAKVEKHEKHEKHDKAEAKAADEPKHAAPAHGKRARMYQPHDTYEVGETIRHPGWLEEGTITDRGVTPDGLNWIMVDFGQRGNKRLIIDYSLKL